MTQMTDCFRILEQNGAPKSERDKMSHFLNQIVNPNEDLRSVMARIRMDVNMKKDFRSASAHLLEAMGSVVQPKGATAGTNRKVAKSETKRGNSGGGNSRNKKQKEKKGQGGPPTGAYTIDEKNGKKYCNGVDITNPKRTFTNEEWAKMGDYIPKLKTLRKVAGVQANEESGDSTGHGVRFGTGAQE